MSQKSVIITAGGLGKRMGSELPKQLLVIGGKEILILY
jgi:2-C-methyl-D-erythritol 4-phosphate cytidylyltransferase